MSERVYMSHPDLPGQRIHVRPAGVAVRQASGWRVESEEDAQAAQLAQVEAARDLLAGAGWTLTPPRTDAGEPADPVPASEPRRRRRTETEGE